MNFKLYLISLFLLVAISVQKSSGCTTFCLSDNNDIIFGRSYDWDLGYGFLMINQRNLEKNRFLYFAQKPVVWTSKYGSVSFNQYGKEYPLGGMNEKGLVIEVMMLNETQYSPQDNRAALDELGWVQYQLDNSASINDVIESAKRVTISDKSLVKLHFLITDSTGNTMAVEFINGKCVFYNNSQLPQECLTNNTYASSVEYLKSFNGFGGKNAIDYQNHSSANSLERFAIAADMIKNYKPEPERSIEDYSFSILDNVKDQKRSQFQIVYNIKKKEIFFRSLESTNIKSINLHHLRFDCNAPKLMFDINTQCNGDIYNLLKPYNAAINKELVQKAYRETGINLPANILEEILAWPETVKCTKD
jgi:choloylglycine hydrolase